METHVKNFPDSSPRAKREHDIRNHLHIIASFTQLMQEGRFGPITAEQREYLGYMAESAVQAQRALSMPVIPVAPVAPFAHREAA